ncbi:MAG: F0F1 ATP synthase subunit epsilon [Armatimonadetes bacterium]|nr:F0F1 ATP synthase subunit epsilon [Armatimonadota bacterium]
MRNFFVEIITPQTVKFQGEINYLEIPSQEGVLGILANHAPAFILLISGKLILRGEFKETRMNISEGFLKVNKNKVLILVDFAKKI